MSEFFTLTVGELIRRLRLVRDLHHPANEGRFCAECDDVYPCDTINIIRAGEPR
jgi:hypothetical protein